MKLFLLAVCVFLGLDPCVGMPSNDPQALISEVQQITLQPWSGSLDSAVHGAGRFKGGAVFDADGDGENEVLLAGVGRPNMVLKWESSQSKLIDIASAINLAESDGENMVGVAACDVTGEGREAVYLARSELEQPRDDDKLYSLDDTARLFLDVQNERKHSEQVACSDAGGSGVYDLLLGSSDGVLCLYDPRHRNQTEIMTSGGDVKLSSFALAPLTPHSPPLPHTALDIFAANKQGGNQLYIFEGLQGGVTCGTDPSHGANRPGAVFKRHHLPNKLVDAGSSAASTISLDINGDSLMDVVVANQHGSSRIFVNVGDGLFEDATVEAVRNLRPASGVVGLDVNNDGLQELLFTHPSGPPTLLQQNMQGDSLVWTSQPVDVLDGESRVNSILVTDLDGDGVLELLVARESQREGESVLGILHSQQTGHFVRVVPYTPFGSPARGAFVRITHMDKRTQSRVIDTGGSGLATHEPVAHFGIGNETSVFSVEVSWADGRSLTLTNPAIDQVLHIHYPSTSNTKQTPFHLTPTSPAHNHDSEADSCLADSCITYEPAKCKQNNKTTECREGFYYDGSTAGKCFCRRGFELSPCPPVGSANPCGNGYSLHRLFEGNNEKCFCRKSDGLDGASGANGISEEAMALFRECLRTNTMGPLRCVAMMEQLGYPHELFGGMQPSPSPSPEPVDPNRYRIDPCPDDSEAASACRVGFVLAREGDECFCERDSEAMVFELDPCPPPSDPNPCPANHHLERENDRCFCHRDSYDVVPCPANDEGVCEESFKLVREMKHGVEKCRCARVEFILDPCPSDTANACPHPLVFERASSPTGPVCKCVEAEEEEEEPCHHCFGYGECAYNQTKGWYCRCVGDDDGPHCIHDYHH